MTIINTMKIDGIYEEFGRRLRSARKAANLTQEDLAERVGLSRTSITNIERGRQHVPLHMLFSLATAVGVEPAELLPQKEAAYTLEMIDQELLKETQLGQEGKEWLQRVLSSRPEGR
jgi:transcriptional regulator with XRE-family HTH domain